VAHTCKPSYSGGKNQKDHGSKSARENSLRDPISKNPHHKKGLVDQGVGPEFKLQPCQKNKNSGLKNLTVKVEPKH
jgi:hypothetical protein